MITSVMCCFIKESASLLQMSSPVDIEKRLTQLQDSMDSLHNRMDRFYSWAGLLQSEFRSMKQRMGFIETMTQEKFDFTQGHPQQTLLKGDGKVFGGEDDNALWARMMRITGKGANNSSQVT